METSLAWNLALGRMPPSIRRAACGIGQPREEAFDAEAGSRSELPTIERAVTSVTTARYVFASPQLSKTWRAPLAADTVP